MNCEESVWIVLHCFANLTTLKIHSVWYIRGHCICTSLVILTPNCVQLVDNSTWLQTVSDLLWLYVWWLYKIRRPHIGAESDLFIHMITQSADRIGWDEVLLYQHTSGVILENHCKRANVVGDEQFWCPVLFNVIFCWVTPTVWKRFKMVDIQWSLLFAMLQ